MKLTKRFAGKLLGLIAVAAMGGCYNYNPAPKAALSNSIITNR